MFSQVSVCPQGGRNLGRYTPQGRYNPPGEGCSTVPTLRKPHCWLLGACGEPLPCKAHSQWVEANNGTYFEVKWVRRLSFCSQGGGLCGWHPRADTPLPCPVHAGIHTPCPVYAGIHTPDQCMLGYTPPPAATAADGTHPTGMHSCYIKEISSSVVINGSQKRRSIFIVCWKHFRKTFSHVLKVPLTLSVMLLAITLQSFAYRFLNSLNDSLQNGSQPKIEMDRQHCRSVHAGAHCKWNLRNRAWMTNHFPVENPTYHLH